MTNNIIKTTQHLVEYKANNYNKFMNFKEDQY